MSGLPVRPPGGSNPGREKVGVGVAANFRPGRGLMWLQRAEADGKRSGWR